MAKDLTIKTVFKGVDQMSKVLGKMQDRIGKFTNSAAMKVRKLDRVMSGTSGTLTKGLKYGFAAATAGALAVGGALWKIKDAFSMFENAEAAFTPMMGGADGARKMIERLKQEAASTPFEFENLANTAQQLLPIMNKDIDLTVKRMRMMGDMAGGNAEKMQRITGGYMKAMLKGKVDMESLNIITEAGIPIMQELAKVMGMETGKKFSKAISKGKVSVDDLTKAMENMTGKGGMFYKGMDLASQTLDGRLSTLRDNVKNAAADLGEAFAPAMKDVVELLIAGVPKVESWIKANKDLIRTKVTDFVKAIPKYLKEIHGYAKAIYDTMAPLVKEVISFVKWVGPKNLAKIVAGIYLVTAATKVLGFGLGVVNKLINFDLGPLRKMGSLFSKAVPDSIANSTTALGKFGKGLGVIGVALAGYQIGTMMYDNLVEPLIVAQDKLDKLIGDVSDTMGRDVSKRNKDQLKQDIKKVDATSKAYESATTTKIADFLPGMGLFTDMARTGLKEEKKRLQSALELRGTQENVAKYGNAPMNYSEANPWEMDNPSVTTAETKSETIIRSEVTIMDQSGRARVTRGANGKGGLNLVHTGGM